MKNLSDEDLWKHYCQHQSQAAFHTLFHRYKAAVWGASSFYLRGSVEDIEDCVMEVFAKLAQAASKNASIDSFKDWLFIVTKNHCLQKNKTNSRLKELLDEVVEKSLDSAVQSSADGTLYVDEDLLIHLDDAIATLDELQKSCLTEFYWNKKSYQDIAALHNISTEAVRTTLQTSKRRLRRLLNP